MKSIFKSTVVIAGLAIFSMFFGAGNLMYPIKTGIASGDHFGIGMLGFLLTAVFLPVVGLIAIILFNGDYRVFFERVGYFPGNALIGFCMCIIGPFIAMSRIVTLSYDMLAPFISALVTLPVFSVFFCMLTYLVTYRENKIIDILGNVISPSLLISLGIILVKGLLYQQPFIHSELSAGQVFLNETIRGYGTLDLLGGIFFGSIILLLLKSAMKNDNDYNVKKLCATAIKSGVIGAGLLAIVYVGMGFLGAFHGSQELQANLAEQFSFISLKVLGHSGALVIATAIFMACFSTIIALATVLGEYLHNDISKQRFSYQTSLGIILLMTAVIACSGLNAILTYSEPIINTFYPVFITITFANIAYKLLNFKPIKLSVLVTLLVSIYCNYPSYALYLNLFN
ncbi:branched-chain amino acid transport system II carrier protein [bacterium]|nr:branched-chain amino acid transport system II carrier protein [bacterium]